MIQRVLLSYNYTALIKMDHQEYFVVFYIYIYIIPQNILDIYIYIYITFSFIDNIVHIKHIKSNIFLLFNFLPCCNSLPVTRADHDAYCLLDLMPCSFIDRYQFFFGIYCYLENEGRTFL